ncbi:phage terminase small subunit [Sellimonas intestinalis]|nr:phage terminase small subunit [Sellimonas intestinalis]DAP82787.1 MAG TPA: Small Terminase [Caudoviricetes sp.]
MAVPRARSPDSIEAEKLYKSGMALVDIAKKLGKPEGTVRRWKSTQKWDENSKKKQGERSQKKSASEKANVRKRGGQPGNQNCKGKQNAKGHGAPKGTQNALKHGGYSAVYWDTLDDEEKELIETMPQDEEEILINQIMLFTVRERRIMKAINKYREAKGGVYVSGVTKFEEKRTFKDDAEKALYDNRVLEKVEKGDRLPGEHYSLQTMTSSSADLVTRLEKELTSVQSQKTKAVDALSKLRFEKEKIAGESKGNELVRTWAESVIKARREKDGP